MSMHTIKKFYPKSTAHHEEDDHVLLIMKILGKFLQARTRALGELNAQLQGLESHFLYGSPASQHTSAERTEMTIVNHHV